MKLQAIIKGIVLSLLVFGLFTVSFAQSAKKHKSAKKYKQYTAKYDKYKKLFKSPIISVTTGNQIVVSGEVSQLEVSGGLDGCYTVTMKIYRIVNGKKILVRTQSRIVCIERRMPDLIIDEINPGNYFVEVGLDHLKTVDRDVLKAKINVRVTPEMPRVRNRRRF